MDGISAGAGALTGALENQSQLAAKVINSGAQSTAQANAGDNQARTTAMQDQGIGQKLDVTA